MDAVSQLQEHANHVASLCFNHIGVLQRDVPLAPLQAQVVDGQPPAREAGIPIHTQAEEMASSIIKAVKTFDRLVSSLPSTEGGEEAQLEVIRRLQAESDQVAVELQAELEAAEADLQRVNALFRSAADDCIRREQ
eukprot:SM000369S13621  [mRNA]  locus=s369:38857:39984:+ [translate_table: standard]